MWVLELIQALWLLFSNGARGITVAQPTVTHCNPLVIAHLTCRASSAGRVPPAQDACTSCLVLPGSPCHPHHRNPNRNHFLTPQTNAAHSYDLRHPPLPLAAASIREIPFVAVPTSSRFLPPSKRSRLLTLVFLPPATASYPTAHLAT